jgi:hypothetical protein
MDLRVGLPEPWRCELGPQKAAKNQKPHQSEMLGARLVALRPSRAYHLLFSPS